MKPTALLAVLPAAALVAVVPIAAPASGQAAPDGKAVFDARCKSCHSLDPKQRAVLGPNLQGVIGRKAGSTDFRYSPAIKSSGIVWSRKNLDSFMAAPGKVVPGTRMVIALPDPAQRAAVVSYLAGNKQ